MRPMRRAKIKLAEKLGHRPKDGAKDGAEIAAVAVADFMLSMVEAHHTRKNGNVIKMESGLKAQKELEKIEGRSHACRRWRGRTRKRCARSSNYTSG